MLYTGSLSGPLPTTFHARILNEYLVKMAKSFTTKLVLLSVVLTDLDSPAGSCSYSTVYWIMMPFLSETRGGLHSTMMEVDDLAMARTPCGAPEGSVMG